MKPPLDPALRSHLLEEGARLIASRAFFRAHEAFEDLWKAASGQRERDLWQGLSQLAAALVKHDRGEPATAITLLAKARSKLTGVRFEAEAAEALRTYLDALAGPVTAEKELPATGLPEPFLAAIRRI
jgi:predicted metal-dependent hydrolase